MYIITVQGSNRPVFFVKFKDVSRPSKSLSYDFQDKFMKNTDLNVKILLNIILRKMLKLVLKINIKLMCLYLSD